MPGSIIAFEKSMIVYQENINNFIRSSLIDKNIVSKIQDLLYEKIGYVSNDGMFRSFCNSLPPLAEILSDNIFNKDISIAIEYHLFQTNESADVILYGLDENDKPILLIIELKQWSDVGNSELPDYVHVNSSAEYLKNDQWHPSIQAYNYANMLINFNKYIQENEVDVRACSFLHNLREECLKYIDNKKLFPILDKSPIFCKNNSHTFREYLSKVKKPKKDLLWDIDNSRMTPSPLLQKMLKHALTGNFYNTLDSNQSFAISKIIQQTISSLNSNKRKTIIIRGKPGTGKSVVAVNAMARLIVEYKKNAVYVTNNKAPRLVYEKELNDEQFKPLFRAAQGLARIKDLQYDCLICDEAHRIQKVFRSGPILVLKDELDNIFRISRTNVFFIDEDQKVCTRDYPTIDLIKQYAKNYNSEIIEGDDLKLTNQFRSMGGNIWIDFERFFLGYTDKKNTWKNNCNFEFQVVDSLEELEKLIYEKDKECGKSRMVAGYCYEWLSNPFGGNPKAYDFDFKNFKHRWNMTQGDYSWAYDSKSVDQIGCIHTCQGIDLNYVGVIIGKDMKFIGNKVHYDKSENMDSVTAKIPQEKDDNLATTLIRNTYQVLLTRGMRGCYVYCEDKALSNYLKSLIKK